jgi:dolichol-phosphate mannosyltransferase
VRGGGEVLIWNCLSPPHTNADILKLRSVCPLVLTMKVAYSPDLSVILPAYEEGECLASLLPSLQLALSDMAVSSEVLVVDTEVPRDDTPDVCRRAGVTYIPRQGGPLYGHAIRTGLAAARGKWIVIMDADGSHDPSFISRLWANRELADIVIASRYVAGGATENPALLILLSRIVNVTFRIVLGLGCADVSNSFRLYRGDHLRALSLTCLNFDLVEEVLVKLVCGRVGYRVLEVPFVFGKRRAGTTKRDLFAFAMSYLGTLIRLWRLKRRSTSE